MPTLLVPLHEFNDCHNPGGPAGGQFCSASRQQLNRRLSNVIARRVTMQARAKVTLGKLIAQMRGAAGARAVTLKKRAAVAGQIAGLRYKSVRHEYPHRRYR